MDNSNNLKIIPSSPSKDDLRYKIYKTLSRSYVNSVIRHAIEKTKGPTRLHNVTPKQLEIIIDVLGVPSGYKLKS
jgi:hypothetical protein